MKRKITGLMLVVLGIPLAIATTMLFVLPKYVPDSGVWLEIFRISIFLGAGLIGMSISLLERLPIGLSIVCSSLGLLMGLLVGWFCLISPPSIMAMWIISGIVVMVPLNTVVLWAKAIEFMFLTPALKTKFN
jgi:hypothetical protein